MRTFPLLLLLNLLCLSCRPCTGRICFLGVLEFVLVDFILWHGTIACIARCRRSRCGTDEPYSHFKFEIFFYTNARCLLDENTNTDLSFAGHKFSA